MTSPCSSGPNCRRPGCRRNRVRNPLWVLSLLRREAHSAFRTKLRTRRAGMAAARTGARQWGATLLANLAVSGGTTPHLGNSTPTPQTYDARNIPRSCWPKYLDRTLFCDWLGLLDDPADLTHR